MKQPRSNLGWENQTELQNAKYKSTLNKVYDNHKVKELTKICIDRLVPLCIIWDESFPFKLWSINACMQNTKQQVDRRE